MKSRLVLDASDCIAMTAVSQHAPEMATQNSESDFSGTAAGTAACPTIAVLDQLLAGRCLAGECSPTAVA